MDFAKDCVLKIPTIDVPFSHILYILSINLCISDFVLSLFLTSCFQQCIFSAFDDPAFQYIVISLNYQFNLKLHWYFLTHDALHCMLLLLPV